MTNQRRDQMGESRQKTATPVSFSIRMDKSLKEQSERVFHALGMTLTTAIQVFLKKAIAEGGLPFEVRLPQKPTSGDKS